MTHVSVIIPLFNKQDSIAKTIRSALAQHIDGLEILVVNDGSTDRSAAIAEEIAANEPHVRVIHRENGGLAAARNTGLDHARGTYIHFLDADDAIPPDALATLIEVEQQHDLGGAVGAHTVRNPDGEQLEHHTIRQNTVGLDDLIDRIGFVVHQPITRRDAIASVRFNEHRRGYEDVDFWLRVAEKGVRWTTTPTVTAHYIMHPRSMSKDSIRMFHEVHDVLAQLKQRQRNIEAGHRFAHIDHERFQQRILHFALTYASQAAVLNERCAIEPLTTRELPTFSPRDAALRGKQALVYGRGLRPTLPNPEVNQAIRNLQRLWLRCEQLRIGPPNLNEHATTMLLQLLVDPDDIVNHMLQDSTSTSSTIVIVGMGQNGQRVENAARTRNVHVEVRDDRFDNGTMQPTSNNWQRMNAPIPPNAAVIITPEQHGDLPQRFDHARQRITWHETRARLAGVHAHQAVA